MEKRAFRGIFFWDYFPPEKLKIKLFSLHYGKMFWTIGLHPRFSILPALTKRDCINCVENPLLWCTFQSLSHFPELISPRQLILYWRRRKAKWKEGHTSRSLQTVQVRPSSHRHKNSTERKKRKTIKRRSLLADADFFFCLLSLNSLFEMATE